MTKVIRSVVSLGATIVGAAIGFAIGGPIGGAIGAALFSTGAKLLLGAPGRPPRSASASQLQLGEQPRQAVLGRSAVAGSLVDAFNYGGKYGTDWEVLVIALADHRCDALEGFFVDDTYVAFSGDGNVAGYNSQLQVFFRNGTWDQTVPSILTSNGPGWTANDRGRGITYVVVAYKADAPDAKNPVWPSGRPRFRWVLRGLRCYQARKDSTVGGSGAHRWDDPATWEGDQLPGAGASVTIAHDVSLTNQTALIEDCTVKAGPATWGKVATSAYERHSASCVVGETNFGGAMVQQTIQVARPRTPFKKVTASRGKVQRAEPFSALYEAGKVRHVGMFAELEDELAGFSTFGYTGHGSPNRADALIWALAELFPGLVSTRQLRHDFTKSAAQGRAI
jgi:hypothetical protein